jgi:hypothetical protein
MMEETYFAGDPPNTALVYKLRKLALTGASLRILIANIGAEISDSEFTIILYFGLSFGVPIHLMKQSVPYLAHDDWLADNAITAIESSIEENRPIWSARLQPA